LAVGNAVNVEPLYRRALAIREQTSVPDHPEVAVLLNNLAEHLRREGKEREAEPLYRRALTIQERRLGSHPDYATTLNNWAEFLAGRRRRRSWQLPRAWGRTNARQQPPVVATIQENLLAFVIHPKNEEALTLPGVMETARKDKAPSIRMY
jgi:hypothetical protein